MERRALVARLNRRVLHLRRMLRRLFRNTYGELVATERTERTVSPQLLWLPARGSGHRELYAVQLIL